MDENSVSVRRDGAPLELPDILRLLDDAQGRLRTVIWALHGMHQDIGALAADDLADLEHVITEILDQLLAPAFEAVGQMAGGPDGVTTH